MGPSHRALYCQFVFAQLTGSSKSQLYLYLGQFCKWREHSADCVTLCSVRPFGKLTISQQHRELLSTKARERYSVRLGQNLSSGSVSLIRSCTSLCKNNLTIPSYLIADYQRGNFSISQCIFQNGVDADIHVIHPLGYVAPSNGTSGGTGDGSSNSSSTSSSFSIGAIVGIVVVVVLLALVGIYLAFAYRKRTWPFHTVKPPGVTELDSDAVGYEADGRMLPGKYPLGDMPHEAEADSTYNDSKVELDSQRVRPKNELPGGPIPGSRLAGSRTELHGSDAALEMDGSGFYQELPADPVPTEYYGRASRGMPRENSMPTTRAASLRDEAVRRGSARSPLSSALGGMESPSPVSAGTTQDGNRLRGSTVRAMSESSDTGTNTSHLMSPISAGSESRDPSRGRGFDAPRRRSPMQLGAGDMRSLAYDAVSRDPNRTRAQDRGDGYHGP